MSNHMIVIEREKAFYGSAIKHSVELDGISIGTLKNGESLSFHTTAGPHMLSFLRGRKQEKSISITIEEEEQIVNLIARINKAQKIEISKSSVGSAVRNNTLPVKKKSGMPLPVRIIIAIFAATVLMGVLFGEESSENPSKQKETATASVELTNEEKAAAQLAKATEEFQSENYIDAIEICNDILSEYSGTDIASGMDSYLDEQFSQYPHYSATELMSEYDANIVNADEEYTGKVMVVSGTVNAIGKTNSDRNLSVMLKSGTYFYGVQLNFKTTQTESVAALSAGDEITVVGKCTGKSGKVLLVIDGENIMIEDCYIID